MNDELRRLVFLVRISLFALLSIVLLWLALLPLAARAEPSIPTAAYQWRGALIAASAEGWGAGAPVATFGAQIEQESAWNPEARSAAGATGLAQFMGSTARWLAEFSPALGGVDTLDPYWSIRALVEYDRYLYLRVVAANDCESMAFALSAYNGGEKYRDRGIARCSGACNPLRWFGNVELVDDGRSVAAWKENRGYPTRILLVREPRYVKSGFGKGICE